MNQRNLSLDVFRGLTVALMILVNNPGTWSAIFPFFKHAPWHGCTPTDLVFPFFLFAVGNAMAFAIPKLQTKGQSGFYKKIVERSLAIFLIGVLLNWLPFFKWEGENLVFKNWYNLRLMGVLQRIALCYFFAVLLINYCSTKKIFYISGVILLAYWGLCLAFGNPVDPYSLTGYFGSYWDILVLGNNHLYMGEGIPFDPEGLISTLPAIPQVLLGYLVALQIKNKGTSYETLTQLAVWSGLFLGAGYVWSVGFPLNKKIWSSSYTLYTTGIAVLTLVCITYLIHFKKYIKYWVDFCVVFGTNPLFIFVLSGFVPRVLSLIQIKNTFGGDKLFINPLEWFYHFVCKPISTDERIGSLFYALCLLAFYWAIAYWMNKKKWFIKV